MNSKKCKKDMKQEMRSTGWYVPSMLQGKSKKKKKNSPERMKEMMTSCVSGIESKG